MHSDLVNGRIGRVYIFFGIVVDHTSYDALIGISLYTSVEWALVEKGHTLVKSEQKDIKMEEDVKIGHTIVSSTDKIRIVAKNNKPHLDGINKTINNILLNEFTLSTQLGGIVSTNDALTPSYYNRPN